MWIVNGELFTNKPEADARVKELNKTHALIHNEDTDDPPKIYKVSAVIHYSEDVNVNDRTILCQSKISKIDKKFFSSIFPHMVSCPICNQLLDQLDDD